MRRSLLLFVAAILASAAAPQVTKVEPPNWWPGHSINPVRLLVRGTGLTRRTSGSACRSRGRPHIGECARDVSFRGPRNPCRCATRSGVIEAHDCRRQHRDSVRDLDAAAAIGALSGLLSGRHHLPDHARPVRERRSVERRSGGLARPARPFEASLLPRRRFSRASSTAFPT